MKRSPGPRKTANLSVSIHQHLNMYTLAAGAAGVGLLALVQPSEAKIVYTRVDKALGIGLTPLDLNNDGTPDFNFCSVSNSSFPSSCINTGNRQGKKFDEEHPPGPFDVLWIFPPPAERTQNRIWGNQHGAFAVRAGKTIGKQLKFTSGTEGIFSCGGSSSGCRGHWQHVTHRYLALKFVISGKIHYGWAGIRMKGCCRATLLGYAYETIANKAIVAGRTKGSDDTDNIIEPPNPTSLTMPAHEPATLGALAMGTAGLSIWRRKETSLDSQ